MLILKIAFTKHTFYLLCLKTRQSTEAYPVLAVYGAVLKEWRTLLLVAAGPHREPGHRKVRDCKAGQKTHHNYSAIETVSTAVSLCG